MRTTSSSPGYFGGQPQMNRPARPCSKCGADMAPGAGSASVSSSTCLMCMAQRAVAIPRARLLIRAGRVEVDPTQVRAFGRGPTKGAKRALRRRERRSAMVRIPEARVVARALSRDADRIRSTRAEMARRAARKEAA